MKITKITCTPSRPAPARPKAKKAAQILQERLTKCETLLQKYAAAEDNDIDASVQEYKITTNCQSDDSQSVGKDVGGPTRKPVDGELWVTLNDEIHKMKKIIEQDHPEGLLPEEDASHVSSEHSSPSSSESLPLDPVTIFKLWQIFLDRVNPLTKIIHAPTVQPFIISAAADISSVPLDQQALLYSIFGLAVLALGNDEFKSIMGDGRPRERVLEEMLQSASVVLMRFDSLRQHNTVILQALMHTSIILMAQCNKHAAWILMGSLVRIAMSMGYHRDGTHFSLSPFETEMRRRIWWQIVMYDIKLGIDSGLTHSCVPKRFDTKQPLNLNDADLFRDATVELSHRNGPTEMAFVMVMNRVTEYFLDEETRRAVEANILGHSELDGENNTARLEHNLARIHKLESDLIDLEKRFIDARASHVHAAALGIRPHLIKRLYSMTRPMQESPDWGVDIFSPRDNLFKLILSSCENASDSYDSMSRWGLAWYIHLHFNLDILASLSTFLYYSPMGSLSNRGWAIFESLYAKNSLLQNLGSKAATTAAQFALKAFVHRDSTLLEAGQFSEVPEVILRLRHMVNSPLVTPPDPTISGQWATFGTMAGTSGRTEETQFMNMFMPLTRASQEDENYNLWTGIPWTADLGQDSAQSAMQSQQQAEPFMSNFGGSIS
ncbi:hypothetical protein NW762_003974 [Fusarium torreyae]|uniref:Xylanolytic transcriptional activator regulatory domain-containing protein n=1 Tax=Fusarium torreyae TaxID=1237075 RepID=A0A9W8VHP4_9HYPO|nr:hypothetical protein NW762_003974 [Fusarium torreyae]